jgi:hypothetical protein
VCYTCVLPISAKETKQVAEGDSSTKEEVCSATAHLHATGFHTPGTLDLIGRPELSQYSLRSTLQENVHLDPQNLVALSQEQQSLCCLHPHGSAGAKTACRSTLSH